MLDLPVEDDGTCLGLFGVYSVCKLSEGRIPVDLALDGKPAELGCELRSVSSCSSWSVGALRWNLAEAIGIDHERFVVGFLTCLGGSAPSSLWMGFESFAGVAL